MNTVNVRKVEIGKGIPKICVPVVGITRDDIIDAACKAKETADLVNGAQIGMKMFWILKRQKR